MGTQLGLRIVLHGLDDDEFHVDSRCENAPSQWIKCLLEPIIDRDRLDIDDIIADCQERVIAARLEEHGHRIELNPPRRLRLLRSLELEVQNPELPSMQSTFLGI